MRNLARPLATLSLVVASGVGAAALAADAAPAAPTGPSLSDVFTASGITATGYVDGTFSYFTYSGTGSPKDYNSFTLQQASVTLASQPTTGFGALVDVVAGQSIYVPNYALYAPHGDTESTKFYLLQGFLQYASGPLTVIAGKFTTLAGAEVVAPTGNTNVTRSLLFTYEPVTHTGVRATWAASDQVSLILGVNNGWYNAAVDEVAAGGDKTVEAGLSFTPNKMFSWTVQGYYGRDAIAGAGTNGTTNVTLLDTVATWNATSALSVVGSIDWGQIDHAAGTGTPAAKWDGYAAYLNYGFSDTWRVSLRAEYFDDKQGFLTGFGASTKLKEGTVTFGYMPDKHFEFRIEGRYDKYDFTPVKSTQGWLEALYKF